MGVESRMLEYTKIEPPKEIRGAGGNVVHGTAQGILLVVVRGSRRRFEDSQTVHSASARHEEEYIFQFDRNSKRCKKKSFDKNGSSLGLGPFSVQFTHWIAWITSI